MASDEAKPESEVLDVRDVLSAIPVDRADADFLGALLMFRTVGDRTLVSVDSDAGGPTHPVQIATLEGITGITLQQLLSTNLDIAC
jgi:hypothetical protein